MAVARQAEGQEQVRPAKQAQSVNSQRAACNRRNTRVPDVMRVVIEMCEITGSNGLGAGKGMAKVCVRRLHATKGREIVHR